MMSLQEIAFCYMLGMLAVPITVCLLMTLRKVKVKEVKVTEQKRTFPTPTLLHWANSYEPCDSYWGDLYEEMCNRQNAKAAGCTVQQLCLCGYKAKDPDVGDGSRCAECHDRHSRYLATREAISSIERADVPVGSCPECGAWSCASILCDKCCSKESHEDETDNDNEITLQAQEEDKDDNRATREWIEKEAFYADLEEDKQALWYEDIEAALSASKTLVPRFKKRKTCFGKDRRENGHRIKYQW